MNIKHLIYPACCGLVILTKWSENFKRILEINPTKSRLFPQASPIQDVMERVTMIIRAFVDDQSNLSDGLFVCLFASTYRDKLYFHDVDAPF